MPTPSHVVVSGLGTAPSSATSIPRFRIAVAALVLLGVGLVSAFVVLGRPRSYSFMDSNAGMSLTFQFRAE